MLRKLLEVESLRGLLPFVRGFYSQPSTYHWQDEDGTRRVIRQCEGGEQGAVLFCLAVHDALAEVKEQLQDGEVIFAFLDDVCVVCFRKGTGEVAPGGHSDLQCARQLLVQCAGPRCHHFIRNVPPEHSVAHAQGHDRGMREVMGRKRKGCPEISTSGTKPNSWPRCSCEWEDSVCVPHAAWRQRLTSHVPGSTPRGCPVRVRSTGV